MRIVRFRTPDGRVSTGRLRDDGHSADILTGDLFGQHSFGAAETVTALLPPVTPPNIFAIGRNYRAHAEELGNQAPEAPLIFGKATTSLLPPDGEIVLPASAPEMVDFEAELAVVIGRTAKRVSLSAARDHVFGFTCANDVSARDCQKSDKQWTRAKGFDTFCPLGPWIVPAAEFDPDNAAIRSRLNGEVMQGSNTANMLHNCDKLVSYLSHQFTLLPGTVILTGTPEGVGLARTPPVFLKAGDVIEVEIEGIGTLSNRVTAEQTE